MPSAFCSIKWYFNTTGHKPRLTYYEGVLNWDEVLQAGLSAVPVVTHYAVTFLVNARAFLSRVTPKLLSDKGKLM